MPLCICFWQSMLVVKSLWFQHFSIELHAVLPIHKAYVSFCFKSVSYVFNSPMHIPSPLNKFVFCLFNKKINNHQNIIIYFKKVSSKSTYSASVVGQATKSKWTTLHINTSLNSITHLEWLWLTTTKPRWATSIITIIRAHVTFITFDN